MLIYKPFEKCITILYHCNALTINNHHSSDENYMNNHSYSLKTNTYIRKLHVSITQTLNEIMVTHMKLKKKAINSNLTTLNVK